MYMNSFACLCTKVKNDNYTLFCWLHAFDRVKNTCSFHPIQCRLNALKTTNKIFIPKTVIFLNSFVCSCMQTTCLIFQKCSESHLHKLQMQYTIFGASAIISFRVMLMKDTQTIRCKYDYRFHETSKRVKSSKSPFLFHF